MKHVWVAVLAACGGSAATPTSTIRHDDDGGGVPPLFAALFVDGKRFDYTVETKTSFWDDADPKADANGAVTDVSTATMSCTVRGMQNFANAVAIKLECDRTDEIAPSGVYIATKAGLWRRDAFPMDDAEIAKLPAAEMILPASPTASENKDEDPDGGGGSMVAIAQHNGRWCKTTSTWGGDEAGDSLCFATGKGLVGGSAWFAGGSSKDITFELVP